MSEVDDACEFERLQESDKALTRVWRALGIGKYTGNAVWEHVSDVLADKNRLQAIVDSLPKTRDGVNAVPGLIVYRWSHYENRVIQYRLPDLTLHEWYSTPEAAETAQRTKSCQDQ